MTKQPSGNRANTYDNMSLGQWLLRVIQGALIGSGAILPGISGGVLCVVFGIYQPMMALLAHPVRSFRVYYKLFIPVLIGWVAGFLGLARVVEMLFKASSSLALWLFVGLIAGTFPSLFREAGRKGTSGRSWALFSLSLVLLFSFLSFLQTGRSIEIEPNGWWYVFCGAVWGLSLVVPGLSSSSILIIMGLYQSMTAGIADIDFGVILPLLAGLAITVAASARMVNHLLERHYSGVSHAIMGVVVASTLLIIPTEYATVWDAVLSLGCFAVGFAIALGMDKYGERIKPQE